MKRGNYKKSAQKVINKVIEKHGYICCEKCGVSSGTMFHTHHIVYRSEAGKHENLHDPRNLILVDDKCHRWFHSKKSNRDDIIKERKLWELFPKILQRFKPD